MNVNLLVLAKQPVPGHVKTRLCPPCTPAQAAAVAAAALADTIDVVTATPAARRWLVLSGTYVAPPGWSAAVQRGDGLGERLANAFADTAAGGRPCLLIGMDTPQVTSELLLAAAGRMAVADAVLGGASVLPRGAPPVAAGEPARPDADRRGRDRVRDDGRAAARAACPRRRPAYRGAVGMVTGGRA
jgi:hypothetical protein